MAENISPSLCPCPCTCDFLSKFDKNVYDIESADTFLKAFFDTVCMEFCDINFAKQMAKNDMYLWKERPDESVVKGEPFTVDCFSCKTVVEIISVGDTAGASDYIEDIDFEIHPCGIKWIESAPYYYAYYSHYYGQTHEGSHTSGRKSKQPRTGDTYYVTYRCGVRNSKLYDVFGILVGLIKKDYQTWPNYRHAIKSLIIAFLEGPTIDGMKAGLSILIPEENIEIIESYKTGWILGESILYPKEWYESGDYTTQDGTILKPVESDYFFDVYVYNSHLIEDKQLFEDVVDKLRPYHTIAYVTYF
jgi:hypothetical protein